MFWIIIGPFQFLQSGDPSLVHWFSAYISVITQQNELSKVAKEPLDLCLNILRSEIFLSLSHFLSSSAFLKIFFADYKEFDYNSQCKLFFEAYISAISCHKWLKKVPKDGQDNRLVLFVSKNWLKISAAD